MGVNVASIKGRETSLFSREQMCSWLKLCSYISVGLLRQKEIFLFLLFFCTISCSLDYFSVLLSFGSHFFYSSNLLSMEWRSISFTLLPGKSTVQSLKQYT